MVFITYVLLFLPFFTAIIWLLQYFLRRGKSSRQQIFTHLLAFSALFFFVDANLYIETEERAAPLVFDVLATFSSLEIPACIIAFAKSLRGHNPKSALSFFLLLPGFVVLLLMVASVAMMGLTPAVDYFQQIRLGVSVSFFEQSVPQLVYYYTSFVLYYALMLLELFITIWYLLKTLKGNDFSIKLLGGFLRGQEVGNINAMCLILIAVMLTCSLRVLAGTSFMHQHLLLSGISTTMIAMLLFLAAYIGLYFEGIPVSFKSFAMPLTPVPDTKFSPGAVFIDASQERAEAIDELKDELSVSRELAEKLQNYFEQDKAYLNPELSVDLVAAEIGTNRTYVSVFVNQQYNLTFRAFINDRRIKAAKTLLMNEPQCTLEEISSRCGFQSLSQFSRKFKEIVGSTPREWQSSINLNN